MCNVKYSFRRIYNKRLTTLGKEIKNQIRDRMDLNNGARYMFLKNEITIGELELVIIVLVKLESTVEE